MADRKHILVISSLMATPDFDGASLRLTRLMNMMRELGCEVTFVAVERGDQPAKIERLEQDHRALEAAGIAAPRVLARDFLSGNCPPFDLVWFSYAHAAHNCLGLVKQHMPSAVTVFDTVDLAHIRLYRAARTLGNAGMLRLALSSKTQELELFARCDWTVVVSDLERDTVAKLCPSARTRVVTNVHAVADGPASPAGRADLLFVGTFWHHPNEDAMLHFTAEIWPGVRERLPAARLWIVGNQPTPAVQSLAGDRVVVTGYVPNIGPYHRRARVFVAPLRFGAGVKGKVLDSMGQGLPVVMTSCAAEGLYVRHGENGLIADAPAGFADAVVNAYQDDALWMMLSANGMRAVAERFSFDAVRAQLRAFLDEAFNRTT